MESRIEGRKFFQWVQNIVVPDEYREFQKSYTQINIILLNMKMLSKPLIKVESIDEIETILKATDKRIKNKKLRNTVVKLLSVYREYLLKNANVQFVKKKSEKSSQEKFLKFNFTNADAFAKTWPGYCSAMGHVIEGKNWARILVGIVEFEIEKNNPKLDVLYIEPLSGHRKSNPFFMDKSIEGLNCALLSNGKWININYSIPNIMKMILEFCKRCGYKKDDLILYGVPKTLKKSSSCNDIHDESNVDGLIEQEHDKFDAKIDLMEKIESHLKSAGLKGTTVENLLDDICADVPATTIEKMLQENKDIICMPDKRYVYIDCFVDFNEAGIILGKILKTHFRQFGGYSNSQLLFVAASRELSMFLNDNDCESTKEVFCIAQFLFEKRAFEGNSYCFCWPHIFEEKPDFPKSLHGLMINLARLNGGWLNASDAKKYLQNVSLSYSSINQLLKIGTSNTFLMYDCEKYLLSERIGIDESWCASVHNRLDDLFRQANVAYVIPRDISISWLETLPVLPNGMRWTYLLLQEVLKKYPGIGFKTISADISQMHSTIVAAFVSIESPIQSFPDLVSLYMEEHYTLPMRMEGEQLRVELRKAGMLVGDELIYTMPKALDDYRFAWSDENRVVYIRGN